MKVPLSWLREFVDLPETVDEIRETMDDLGLVVEGVERVGDGLNDVVVVRVDEIHAIPGADRIRRVVVDTGAGPLEIVCGAWNFGVGDHVPLAPVGAVLPGGFEIARRAMRGVVSNGMLCSARELRLSDDHEGLMVLDEMIAPRVGEPLLEALGIVADVVFDVSIEGNRPDAWSILGVARDLAARFGRTVRAPEVAGPSPGVRSDSVAGAAVDAPDLCGRLTVSVLRNVRVAPSPAWVTQRLQRAGMRSISNVVDASNIVMLELGQPTHPYDAMRVAGGVIRVRRARLGESLETLDGVVRALAQSGRGLGDSGDDLVIVDGDDVVLGLAGIMGGATSEISAATTEVLLEAAYFDPMAIARSSKRHGLRTEASARFERGVDPELALHAVGRLVAVLRESVPDLEWLDEPLDVRGEIPTPSTVRLNAHDVSRSLGVSLPLDEVATHLEALGFLTSPAGDEGLNIVAPSSRPDVRTGVAGRADVIEEIARLHSYRRLPRRTPSWPAPGALNDRQRLRRLLRGVIVEAGVNEAWTPTLVSVRTFDLTHQGGTRITVTNPLAADESVLRPTMLTGLVAAWGENVDRGFVDVRLGELGTVFTHPEDTASPRVTRGGAGGRATLALPQEGERLTVVLGHRDDDAISAVALWARIATRLDLDDVVVRSSTDLGPGIHPTRGAGLRDRTSGTCVGIVGEVDPELIISVAGQSNRRLGVVDVDLDALIGLVTGERTTRRAALPSRFPSAVLDLAFVTPDEVHAEDLRFALRSVSPLVEDITLFDAYRGSTVAPNTRSLAFAVRLSSPDHTLGEAEVAAVRQQLIDEARTSGAVLRS